MSFCVNKIIIRNRAPFENISLSFEDKSIAVLTALNGKGKTTILSYIVDAWVELTKNVYSNSYAGRENSYYRVSSPLYDVNSGEPSLVYIRFVSDGKFCDYVDVRNGCPESFYNSAVDLVGKIPYAIIKQRLSSKQSFKIVNEEFSKGEVVKGVFDNNLATYFPSYRFELPNYLNECYKQDVTHKLEVTYNGYLSNPFEVTSDVKDIANWILDVVLDKEVNEDERRLPDGKLVKIQAPELQVWMNAKKVLECALISKYPKHNVRFGIGRRNNSGSRLSIMEINPQGDKQYCPTIFNLSSGELSVLAIFAEILRRADDTFGMIPMEQFHGIVLIDEIDMHLHIQLQKEVLPLLLNLFPNIQFIVSSHSPFLNMGLAEMSTNRTTVYDLDNNGIESTPTTNEVYQEAYTAFMNEKNKYAERCASLEQHVRQSTRPLIITEGKTDTKHLKAALSRLTIDDLDLEFYEIGETDWGDSKLKAMLEHLCRIKQDRLIIGIFDRDSEVYVSYVTDGVKQYKNFGNNVYAFAIPLVHDNLYGDKISIEHYYNRENLLSVDENGRRLFLGDEFYASGNSKDSQFQTKISKIQNKVAVNGIIDEKVYLSNDLEQKVSVACSKDSFAENVLNNVEYTRLFDMSSFTKIFDIIRQIIQTSRQKGCSS